MLKRSNLLLLTISMVLALVTTVVVMGQINKVHAKVPASSTVGVVVVLKDVAPHVVITQDDVTIQQIPSNAVSMGALTSLADVVGHYSSAAWFSGQQVVQKMVTDKDQTSSFPLEIPAGTRAFTLPDDAVTGVDHLISQGDRVDIIASWVDKQGIHHAQVILQNVLVLYVDNAPVSSQTVMVNGSQGSQNNTSSNSSSGGKTVDTITVAIHPQDLATIDLYYSYGTLHAALRNPDDKDQGSLTAAQGQ